MVLQSEIIKFELYYNIIVLLHPYRYHALLCYAFLKFFPGQLYPLSALLYFPACACLDRCTKSQLHINFAQVHETEKRN